MSPTSRSKGRLRQLLCTAIAASTGAFFLAGIPATVTSASPSFVVNHATPMTSIGRTPEIPLGDHALGVVPSTSTQTGAVILKSPNESSLTEFISSVTSKTSTQYHHYLSHGEFASLYGPSAAEISTVESALRSEGLTVTNVSSDHLMISFRATSAVVETAFRTSLESYHLASGGTGQATTSAISLPTAISSSILGVVGLDNLVREQSADITPAGAKVPDAPHATAPAIVHPAGAPNACADAQQAATESGGLTDDQIANAYGAFGLYNEGDFGQGQHVAVYELEPYLTSDIEQFDTCYFGSAESALMAGTSGNSAGSRLAQINVDGGELAPGPGSQNDEANLDIEDVAAIAPGANIDVYEAPNTTFGGLDEYAAIVNNDVDQVVTSSWGVCEQLAQVAEPGLQQAENEIFEQAAAQGQTVLSAEGDTGDDSCNESRELEPPTGQNLLSVLDPASQPYVVSVGGTTIDNATQPPSEQVWNDGAEWGGAGGGISESWAMPSWQVPVATSTANSDDVTNAESVETASETSASPFATPTFCDGTVALPANSPCRETPDVSAQADEFTGSITIYGESLGYGLADGWATIGGTSSATPIWAAMLALTNASSPCSSDFVEFAEGPVPDAGFASPILYGIAANAAAYAASFNDVVVGNNDVFGLDDGLVFPARTGYDMASGLGSPQLTGPTGSSGLAYYMCNYGGALAPPTVTGVSPSVGSVAGGEVIDVAGTGFGTSIAPLVANVQVGTATATTFSVVNNTTLSVTVPPASATVAPTSPDPTQDGSGPAHIVVTTTSGQSSTPTASSLFAYVDTDVTTTVPSITTVSPSGGLDTDPATVTIYGSGFAPTGDTVDFGSVAASNVTYVSQFELQVSPPSFSSLNPATDCPTDTVGTGINPDTDVCQVTVTVTANAETSATATILPPFEGTLAYDAMGAETIPSGCGCEDEPQSDEYDYAPAPTVTSVSTGTIGDLPANASALASEFGGATSNTVVVTGTGMDPLTFDYATLGTPANENSIFYPIEISGTSMTLLAPSILPEDSEPSIEPVSIPVGLASLAGVSATVGIVYSGVPVVEDVVNTHTDLPGVEDTTACVSPPLPTGCGEPLEIDGSGLLQSSGPLGYVDNDTGTSLGLQYNYDVEGDNVITTQSVAMNPDVVDVEVCSTTGCSYNPPDDLLYVYPPGNPTITSLSASSGPASGGNTITINGTNLGCAVEVLFGSTIAYDVSNTQALLDCGSFNQLSVVVPPGQASTVTSISVVTVESILSNDGAPSNPLGYEFKIGRPSPPQSTLGAGEDLVATANAGSVNVTWAAPSSNGGRSVTGYVVTAKSPGFDIVKAVVGARDHSATFKNLQAGAPWTLAVSAINSFGVGLAAASFPVTPSLGDAGYLLASSSGGVLGFGDVLSHGGIGGEGLHAVGIAATSDGLGYWILTNTGKVLAFGDAPTYGSAAVDDAVAIAAMPSGQGYWIVSRSGVVRAFGAAVTYAGTVPKGTIVTAMASSSDGRGYWLVGSNGVVKAFGDAGAYSRVRTTSPIVAIARTSSGDGYWLVASNGTVSSRGDAHALRGRAPLHVVGIATAPVGIGYWLVTSTGEVYGYGSAKVVGRATSGMGIAL